MYPDTHYIAARPGGIFYPHRKESGAMSECDVIAIANQKGGTTKTTTTTNLGIALAQMHSKRVLLVDADPNS
jgi:Mrp family chromosome partitioning ATPase